MKTAVDDPIAAERILRTFLAEFGDVSIASARKVYEQLTPADKTFLAHIGDGLR